MSAQTATNLNYSLPNPLTPLAFLEPSDAYNLSVTNYVLVGSLAVLIWDILDNDFTNFRLFFPKSRPTVPVVAYILSRIGTFMFAITASIFSSAPIGNCEIFNRVSHAWCPVAISFSAYLFFLRLRAIYNGNQMVIGAFFVMWLGVTATSMLVPVGMTGSAVGPTAYCMTSSVNPSVSAGQVSPMVFDTLVYCAISWKLARTAIQDMPVKESLRVMIFGKGLPLFTRSILLDGQAYYLITLIVGIVANVLIFAPSVPHTLRPLGNAPYIIVVNIMACRVYRKTRAGAMRDSQLLGSTKASSNRNTAKNSLALQPIAFSHPQTVASSYSDTRVSSDNASHRASDAQSQKVAELC